MVASHTRQGLAKTKSDIVVLQFSDLFVRGRISYKAEVDKLTTTANHAMAKVLSYRPVTAADLVATATTDFASAKKLVRNFISGLKSSNIGTGMDLKKTKSYCIVQAGPL
jgi:hypothetical protein